MKIIQEKNVTDLSSHIENMNIGESDLHWHEKYELCRVINKPCNFLIDGVLYKAEPGDIITIHERSIHKFLIKENDTLILIMQFPLKYLLNAHINIALLKTLIKAEEIKNIPNLEEKLDTLFDLLNDEYRSQNKNDNLFFQSLATSLYFLLMRHFTQNNTVMGKKDRVDFYKIVEFTNKNYKEGINLKTVSASLFIPEKRTTNVFFKYSGMKLIDYISSLRIKNVLELLAEGVTITEAAFESGFGCIRTFNNVFKDIMKMTPTEYLKTL